MAINIVCRECQRNLKVGDEHAGKQVRCPTCKAVFTVPQPMSAEPIEELPVLEEIEPPSAPPSRSAPPPPPLPARSRAEEPDDYREPAREPRRRREKQPQNSMTGPLLGFAIGGFLVLLISIGSTVISATRNPVRQQPTFTPAPMQQPGQFNSGRRR